MFPKLLKKRKKKKEKKKEAAIDLLKGLNYLLLSLDPFS
jgi:hypothetical protein